MDSIRLIAQILGTVSVGLALMSITIFFRARWPAPVFWLLKLYVSALSPLFLLTGVVSIIAGLAAVSIFSMIPGIYVAAVYLNHIFSITRPPNSSNGFELAFGSHWEDRISPNQERYFLPKRMVFRLPAVPNPLVEQNISFGNVPGTARKLLCDIWQPHFTIKSSGLAFIYLHGGAWNILDKGLGTRPFFSHLAAQGHVVMDVAYRLAPETDMMGMIHDVKRAIVWMKENALFYSINPERIVLGGGSSGGHLALLAAYTATNQHFNPMEFERKDTSVTAVISYYGPADLAQMYYHSNQHLSTRSTPGKPKKSAHVQMPGWIIKIMGKEYYRLGFDKDFVNGGTFAALFGGHPDECPETYAFFSPITHIHTHCPPTLLIHGDDDTMAPPNASRLLFNRLSEIKVPAVMHILPETDHAFDLILPKISPSSHNALYDVERFLAIC